MSYKKPAAKSLQKYSVSDRDFLNKKLKTSERYSKVRSKTNSGFNATRRDELEKEIRKYYRVRNDEVFRRISLVDLLHLMVIYAEECNITRNGIEEQDLPLPMDGPPTYIEKYMMNRIDETAKKANPLKYKDDISEVVHKMEYLDLPTSTQECENEFLPCPYLILDIRPSNEFARGHLATAVCHPRSRLSRAVGWESSEMLAYKNHSDWIIVVCDNNETIAPEVASILIHRGYSNVFMLSGGLRLVHDKIGPPLITTDLGKDLSAAVGDFLTEKLSRLLIPPLRMEDASNWWKARKAVQERKKWGSLDSGLDGNAGGRRRPESEDDKKKPWK